MCRGMLLSILVLGFITQLGCQKARSSDNTSEVPELYENPFNETQSKEKPKQSNEDGSVDENKQTEPPVQVTPPAHESSQKNSQAVPQIQSQTPPSTQKPPAPVKPAGPVASRFIQITKKVIATEAKQIGTACNAFVQRVLQLNGFENRTFLANDFDLYAETYFGSYVRQDFVYDSATHGKVGREKLRKYIWSFPARTPFIFQWQRTGPHGHIAIVERVGDQLVIYQANLGRYTARSNKTIIEALLYSMNRGGRQYLSVYSNFKP